LNIDWGELTSAGGKDRRKKPRLELGSKSISIEEIWEQNRTRKTGSTSYQEKKRGTGLNAKRVRKRKCGVANAGRKRERVPW